MEACIVRPTEVLLSFLNYEEESQTKGLLLLLKQIAYDWVSLSTQLASVEKYVNNANENSLNYKLAALLISILYYYVNTPQKSLQYAFKSQECLLLYINNFYPLNYTDDFESLHDTSIIVPEEAVNYINFILTLIIDKYISTKAKNKESCALLELLIKAESVSIILVGLALDSMNLDLLKRLISQEYRSDIVEYLISQELKLFKSRTYRDKVFSLVLESYEYSIMDRGNRTKQEYRQSVSILFKYIISLNDNQRAIKYIKYLFEADILLCYQICIQLQHNARQCMIEEILRNIETNESMNFVCLLLNGSFKTQLLLRFCNSNIKTNLTVYEELKSVISSKPAVIQLMLIIAHAFNQRGTTCDNFFRQNLSWFTKPMLWNKFTAIASLGVIHQTHTTMSMKVLSTYLPNQPGWKSGQVYEDGGGLFALGLVHANRGTPMVVTYLKEQLEQACNNQSNNNPEITQYGVCLACGLVGIGTAAKDYLGAMETVLASDNCISGEAAAIGIGLIYFGTCLDEIIQKLCAFAEESRHEKLIRACSFACALVLAQGLEAAEPYITTLLASSNPLIRAGGAYAIGLAYVGTANPAAIKALLDITITDNSDDVCQAAVFGLAFLYIGSGELPHANNTFRFLIDSFNFRIRYAAAMGIGLYAAGTGDRTSIELLMLVINDTYELVRQASYIGISMILMLCSENYIISHRREHTTSLDFTSLGSGKLSSYPTITEFRSFLVKVSTNSFDDVMARAGALIGIGLLDAGGRNVTLATNIKEAAEKTTETTGIGRLVQSDTYKGVNLNISTIAGFALFTQMWYWHPFLLALSIAMRPCGMIGILENGKVPKSFFAVVNCKEDDFATAPDINNKVEMTEYSITRSILNSARRAGINLKEQEEIKSKQNSDKEKQKEKQKKESEVENQLKNNEKPKDVPLIRVINNGERLTDFEIALGLEYPPTCRYEPVLPTDIENGLIVLESKDSETEETYILE